MPAEKATAIVLRTVEFSETSLVVTLFTREFGKIGALAKGGRRLKGPFESALDLLALCRIVFLRKSSDALDLLTEAKLLRRFRPAGRDLSSLYAGYYVAELLGELTDDVRSSSRTVRPGRRDPGGPWRPASRWRGGWCVSSWARCGCWGTAPSLDDVRRVRRAGAGGGPSGLRAARRRRAVQPRAATGRQQVVVGQRGRVADDGPTGRPGKARPGRRMEIDPRSSASCAAC